MAKTPAQSARAILHIIVSGGTHANEIIMYGEVERAFLETDSTSTPQEFVEGLNERLAAWRRLVEDNLTLFADRLRKEFLKP